MSLLVLTNSKQLETLQQGTADKGKQEKRKEKKQRLFHD